MQIKPILREFKAADLPEIVRLWNENVIFDPITPELLQEKTFGDKDFQPAMTLVAEHDSQIIGFMQGLHRITVKGEHIGWIKLFFTVRPYHRQGIASLLLDTIEKQLWQAGVSEIRILDSNPNYLQPGLDPFYTEAIAFLERRGYRKSADTSNLVTALNQNFDTSAEAQQLAQQGIDIRRATLADQPQIRVFISQNFAAWNDEVQNTFRFDPITLHLAFYHGELKAFSAHNSNNFNTGWFGPMGTDPIFRGKGVGGILLKRCLQDMKDQGLKTSIIPWVGPIPFYMHYCNARLARIFWRYRKVVEQKG